MGAGRSGGGGGSSKSLRHAGTGKDSIRRDGPAKPCTGAAHTGRGMGIRYYGYLATLVNSGVCLGKHYFRPTNFRDPENWVVVKF